MPVQQQKVATISDLLHELTSSVYDPKSTINEQYVAYAASKQYTAGLLKAHDQVVIRNEKLTGLLEHYIKNYDEKTVENRRYKEMLFNTFVGLFILLTFGIFVVFIRTDLNEVTVPLAVSLISVGATYVGSIFVVYEIMFRYLFPVDEEKDMITMIKTVIDNDLKLEEFALRVPSLLGPANREQRGGKAGEVSEPGNGGSKAPANDDGSNA